MSTLGSYLYTIFLLFLIVYFSQRASFKRGFYRYPLSIKPKNKLISGKQLLAYFFVYVFCFFFLARLFLQNISPFVSPSYAFAIALTSSSLLCFFFLFILWRINPKREPVFLGENPPLTDIKIGLLGWIIGSFLAFLLGQISDLCLYLKFGELHYEQAAVHQLKVALANPPILVATLFSILIFAPIAEEFLFRYALQNYLKKYLNTKYAILVAGFAFALLHLSPSQGIGNITLMISLWTLGSFLGWVYERQGSLLTSITLHAIFNGVSTLQIIFFSPEI